MGYLLYNLLVILVSPFAIMVLLMKKRCRRGLVQRLGWVPLQLRQSMRSVIWVHAVSLGEVVAVVPLVKALHGWFPNQGIIVSTVTDTGREAVEQRLKGIATHCYLPLDFPWAVERYVRILCPIVFIFVETELWPNLLKSLHRNQVPSILVNGRLSSRSFRRYRIIRKFMVKVLSNVSLFLMQSFRDVERIQDLGAKPERIHQTGNMKFDQGVGDPRSASPHIAPSSIGIAEDEWLIVAGSTHPGEEEQCLQSYERVSAECPTTVLLMAPRHIERVDHLEEKIRSMGFKSVRRSQVEFDGKTYPPTKGPRVIILDTRGELAQVYALGRVAFVGGTLVPIGGHNLLEPAQWGKPVIFGPFTDHCAEVARLLVHSGGGIQVKDGEELTIQLIRILQNPDSISKIGEAARDVVEANRGVVKRNVELIRSMLDSNSSLIHGESSMRSEHLQEHIS